MKKINILLLGGIYAEKNQIPNISIRNSRRIYRFRFDRSSAAWHWATPFTLAPDDANAIFDRDYHDTRSRIHRVFLWLFEFLQEGKLLTWVVLFAAAYCVAGNYTGGFFSENLGNPEANWKPWYLVIYGVFSVVGVGVREECIFRATIQNILAKKYANSVNGIWITAIVSALIFGLTHVTNVLFGVEPLAVLTQVLSAACLGLLLGAVYLRSGSIWALILIHTLIDIAGLAGSTFLYISDIEDLNQLSWSWGRLIIWLVYIGFAAFLLRPSKCKQICESFCFSGEETEAVERT